MSLPRASQQDQPAAAPALLELPGLWRGSELARSHSACVASGFAALDAELPGGGWPTQAISEILLTQPGACEWRLLGPALRRLLAPAMPTQATSKRRTAAARAPASAAARPLLLINPPWAPHLPGLAGHGIAAQQLVWIAPQSHAHALWATEQAIKANAGAAVLAWLPEARPEQIRRLQAAALSASHPVFLLRPAELAQPQSSAAALRLRLEPDPDWQTLRLHIVKRRGPAHEGWLSLPAPPAGLAQLLAPRLRLAPTPIAVISPALPEPPHEPARALDRPALLQP